MSEKDDLRTKLRAQRRTYVEGLPEAIRALIMLRPPAPIARLAASAGIVGLYHASPYETPARSYAKWFQEQGKRLALPWFTDRTAPMLFREWRDPHADSDLEVGPWGTLQPAADAPELVPDVAFVPLLGFTSDGHRIGQGGGHYDRWLAANPQVPALGLGWDCQMLDKLPLEPHDHALLAVITPTRIYGDLD